ncbi:early nodulin-like protein 7 [Vicia villosa]|uniref:early nodulin-like protein 7 n=1 Tax=Vicia villosa TaxID=3911 RepID=UPI00273AB407|nr:early nodulin-like protein 7 [Vicia villosa]
MSSFLCIFFIIFLAVTTSVQSARQFHVGDHFGWRQPDQNNADFYTKWARINRFQIGDSLVIIIIIHVFLVIVYVVFEYENDSVLSVEKEDYINCDTSKPITTFTNGKSTLNLDRSGPFYFISGTDDHCNNGQKLLVEVMAPHPIPASPPTPTTIAVPPEGSSSPMMAPSNAPYSSDTLDQATSSSSMVVVASCFMSTLVTFVIVIMLG